MWFFGVKRIDEQKAEVGRAHALSRLKAFRGVGERFNYLGVEMVVTGHSETLPGAPMYGGPYVDPKLIADYVNAVGDINTIKFGVTELGTLIAENPGSEGV